MTDQTGSFKGDYDYLAQLTSWQLEALLVSVPALEKNEALLDAISEVLIEKERVNPSGLLPDVDAAWKDFQTYFNSPDGKGRPRY